MVDIIQSRKASAAPKWLGALMTVLFVILALLVTVGAYVIFFYSTPLTLPDTVTVRSLTAADQDTLRASQFVRGLEGTGISVSFQEYDEAQLGEQEVTLVFTQGRRTCTRKVKLYRFRLEPMLTVQLGEETGVSSRDFVPDENVEAVLLTPLEEGMCGIFTLRLLCGDQEYAVQCAVEEDIPPQGVGREVTVEAGTVPEAAELVTDIQDHTQVTVTYREQPELVLLGQHTLILVLTDLFGNTAEVEATVNVIPAENGPQFTGLDTLYVELGTAVSYKTGVTATDAQDGQLSFMVDTGELDSKTVGRYTVFYAAVDSDGNRLIAPRTVVVESHVGQLLREKAQAVLDQIIRPDMTHDEKIRAVFNRAKYYVYYSGSSDKSSLENAAYEGFTKNAGDCYTYYAMIKVMLDLLEIPNVEVRRVGGTSDHWWNLVQFEDGKYYHVDATPHSGTWMLHFKMTESTIVGYTNEPSVAERRPNYYVYDHTLPQYQGIEIAQ